MTVDIIQHPGEVQGKSTAVHAALLAPAHVTIHTFPVFPDFNREKTILVFPKSDAINVKDLIQCCTASHEGATSRKDTNSLKRTSSDEGCPGPLKRARLSELKFDRVVFIDSTWHQTAEVCSDERLKDLRCVVLEPRETKFWRTQKNKPATYLSTIEAIYFFFRELYAVSSPDEVYDGRLDQLLLLFHFMYNQVHQQYGPVLKGR